MEIWFSMAGPIMVCHMVLIIAHELIHKNHYPMNNCVTYYIMLHLVHIYFSFGLVYGASTFLVHHICQKSKKNYNSNNKKYMALFLLNPCFIYFFM